MIAFYGIQGANGFRVRWVRTRAAGHDWIAARFLASDQTQADLTLHRQSTVHADRAVFREHPDLRDIRERQEADERDLADDERFVAGGGK